LKRFKAYRLRPSVFSSEDSRRGFTLLEILVAIGLTGAVMGAVFAALGQSLRIAAATESRTTALLLTQARLSVLLDSPQIPEEGGGLFEPPFDRFSWHVDVAPPLSDDLVPVSLTSGPAAAPSARRVTLFTYYYKRARNETPAER